MWRALSTEDMSNYYTLSKAIGDGDMDSAGEAFGKFVAAFMQVEIPNNTAGASYS